MQKRPSISVATRVTTTLILLSLASAVIAHISIQVPGLAEKWNRQRTVIGETIAANCASLVDSQSDEQLASCLANLGARNSEIFNAQVIDRDGQVRAEWFRQSPKADRSADDGIRVTSRSFPMIDRGQRRGVLKIQFSSTGWLQSLYSEPVVLASAIAFALNALFFRWHVGRVLNLFDPVSAVPQHMSPTINSFAEGVVILDNENRIILVNEAFAHYFSREAKSFIGQPIDEYAWQPDTSEDILPWQSTLLRDDDSANRISLCIDADDYLRFRARSAPILDEGRVRVGAIVCFDNVTSIEEKREALRAMLTELRKSRDELTVRNEELQILATRDPLTGCLNRRTFFELFDKAWQAARHSKQTLSCAMLDIDSFKAINDTHGHPRGDEVLRSVANSLLDLVHPNHVVCRYGGEEFCILMPSVELQQAEELSDKIRTAISELRFPDLQITASIGLSATTLSPIDPQAMIDQADKCLYIAKRSGRNQTVRWDEVPDNVDQMVGPRTEDDLDGSIPYPAVASLMSALAYRHPDTAAHSTRVAELAVVTARGLMTAKEAYLLEIGALLHDIGKIGVPDAILLKPGPLTSDEWDLMRIHDRIGVEIIESSFANPQLVDILRYHHVWYGRRSKNATLPIGKDIPLAARIVAIADAYDAIVSDRVYRKGRSQQEAFVELRRCAGTQFDPDLVERFIKVVEEHKFLDLPVGSKYSALQIGRQIERLSKAVDDQDRVGILALASRLEATAAHCNIAEIRNLAAELKRAASKGDDVEEIIEMTHHLIDLCRSTQRAYVGIDLWDAAEAHRELSSLG